MTRNIFILASSPKCLVFVYFFLFCWQSTLFLYKQKYHICIFKHLSENQGSAAKQKRTNEKLITKLEDHFKDPYTRVCRNRGIKRFPEKFMLLPFVWFFCTYQVRLFNTNVLIIIPLEILCSVYISCNPSKCLYCFLQVGRDF